MGTATLTFAATPSFGAGTSVRGFLDESHGVWFHAGVSFLQSQLEDALTEASECGDPVPSEPAITWFLEVARHALSAFSHNEADFRDSLAFLVSITPRGDIDWSIIPTSYARRITLLFRPDGESVKTLFADVQGRVVSQEVSR